MKKMNKIFLTLLLLVSVFASFASPVGAEASAEENLMNVTLHKRHKVKTDSNKNTGEEMLDFGGVALEGAGFTAYDVTAKFNELMKNSDEVTAMKAIQDLYTPSVPTGAVEVGVEVLTDKDGVAVFPNLGIADAEGNYKVYIFVETTTPTTVSVTEKSVPLVLALPIYKMNAADGTYTDELNRDVHLYPKNVTAEDEKLFMNPKEFTSVDVDGKLVFNVTTGSVLDFNVNLIVPIDIADKEEYSLSDNPTVGLAYQTGTIKIGNLVLGEDYTVEEDLVGGFKIVFNVESTKLHAYAGKTLTVEYQMMLTAEVTPDSIYENKAHVSVDRTPRPDMKTKVKTDPEDPEYPPVFSTNGHKFVKEDAKTGDALAGAEFILGNKKGEFAQFATDKNSKGEYVFVKWGTKDEAAKLVSDSDGEIKVIGLTKDNYILNETKAPSDKYVQIKGDIEFTVVDGYATTEFQSILNHPKGLLPSTGGSGIYAYLVIGTLMMFGSVIWFKRSNQA